MIARHMQAQRLNAGEILLTEFFVIWLVRRHSGSSCKLCSKERSDRRKSHMVPTRLAFSPGLCFSLQNSRVCGSFASLWRASARYTLNFESPSRKVPRRP
jgi:hypothetical protein